VVGWTVSFYIRYVLTDDRTVSLGELEGALRQIGQAYAIDGDLIKFGEAGYGLIDITHRGDPICDDDLDLLSRLAEKKRHREVIRATVRDAKGLVCVQPLNTQGARTGEVLAPIWDWLLANRAGLLAWEGGHFFDRPGELT
jgi:hypothetical protein